MPDSFIFWIKPTDNFVTKGSFLPSTNIFPFRRPTIGPNSSMRRQRACVWAQTALVVATSTHSRTSGSFLRWFSISKRPSNPSINRLHERSSPSSHGNKELEFGGLQSISDGRGIATFTFNLFTFGQSTRDTHGVGSFSK